ncbi:MFS transporter [Kribbella capetownensis]|uniref:MFS transporter n=1 Tax=Kribbella capetownensis TaxID=1572659 RepID=A0A4R0JNT4_9ACTN|nr:MFS transporter [Kribbella capetownensis]TCC48893.1 MFS transporter [Kribbella capetownensis]
MADRTSPEPQSLWRNRDYLSWWTGTAFSVLGSNVSVVAFPLLVVFGTGSVFGAGVIAAAGRIGLLITTLWGGALADRVSRRLILVGVPLLQAVLMAGVTIIIWTGHVWIPVLGAIGLLAGLLVGVASGAELPALRRIVPREQFAARAAQEQGLHQAAQLIASPLAALLYTLARWLPFALDAVTFLLGSLFSALIRRPLGPEPRSDDSGGKPSFLADVRGGLRVVRRTPFLRYTMVWVAVTNMVGNSFLLLLIVLLKERGAGPRTIGVINSMVLIGGLLGAVLAGRILERAGSRRVFLIGGWVYVVTLALAAVSPQQWQIALTAALFVFASVPTVSVWEAYLASLVPDEFVGRVGSVANFAAQSLVWLGLLLVGLLVDHLGATVGVLCYAALLVPFAVCNLFARSLAVLSTPLAQVREVDVT